ncbi:Uncharacterised protein [Streptococcus pneumoniae]|nr:Uncharacterised protein [Streptococcus pneumoniae]
MKDVSLFLLKKVFKSRLNWIILALFVSVLGVTFYFNSQTANSVSLERELETRLVDRERVINEYEAKLSQMSDTSSEEYQFAKSNLELQKNLLKRKTEILTLLKEGRWKEAYYLQWQDEEKNYEFVSNDPTASSGLKMGVDRERKIYQALYPLNIKAHTLEFPTHGIDQIVWILEVIIPSLFVVAIIFMLTQLFAERYQNHLDTAHLYPNTTICRKISKSSGHSSLISCFKSDICNILSWSWSGICNCAVYRNLWLFFSSGKSDKWFWTVRLSLPNL